MKNLDYNRVRSMSEEEFSSYKIDIEEIRNSDEYIKTDLATLEKIERFLDVKKGSLKDVESYLLDKKCVGCGKNLDLFDKVMTAVVDADHSKSFILHTMLGNKKTASRTEFTRCSSCGEISPSADWSFWIFIYCEFARA